ncbi:hypothetical protein BZG36_02695 [Bifiguratus adelaidae]|uniref:Rad4 beta-hairpin domain-containing protein n=1 Tax=Bifiguratus adelaidae TaxID=1938954 RepID=A0A261Y1V5_9FUNG|nr:hypothetical protein BZG36_02695 [Bifiguratus adelaidae]
MGDDKETTSYREVALGRTKFAEALRVYYNPNNVTRRSTGRTSKSADDGLEKSHGGSVNAAKDRASKGNKRGQPASTTIDRQTSKSRKRKTKDTIGSDNESLDVENEQPESASAPHGDGTQVDQNIPPDTKYDVYFPSDIEQDQNTEALTISSSSSVREITPKAGQNGRHRQSPSRDDSVEDTDDDDLMEFVPIPMPNKNGPPDPRYEEERVFEPAYIVKDRPARKRRKPSPPKPDKTPRSGQKDPSQPFEIEDDDTAPAVDAKEDGTASSDVSDDSDNEMEWETVYPPPQQETEEALASGMEAAESRSYRDVQITFEAPKMEYRKAKGMTKGDRRARKLAHQTHLLCLLAHGMIRNRLASHPEAMAHALSIIPQRLQYMFSADHINNATPIPINEGTSRKKGKQTERSAQDRHLALMEAVKAAMTWWRDTWFHIVARGVRSRQWMEYGEGGIEGLAGLDPNERENEEDKQDVIKDMDEFIHIMTSVRRGDRDTAAQLFASVLRIMGIETRLVCSLQAVSFSFTGDTAALRKKDKDKERDTNGSTSTKKKKKEKKREQEHQESDDLQKDNDDEDESNNSSNHRSSVPLRTRAPRLTTPPPSKRPTTSTAIFKQINRQSMEKSGQNQWTHALSPAPIWWLEIYSEHIGEWITVDPIRGFCNQPNQMEPVGSSSPENILSYVVAFEQDGDGVRDVTSRYSSSFTGRTRKLRLPPPTKTDMEQGFGDFWEEVTQALKRRKRAKRDDVEVKQLQGQTDEAMPTNMAGFNNHPLYALERHLKRYEILYPREPVIGHWKGEPIYPRANVKRLCTAETWLKEGRVVKPGEQPLKHVKSRAMTINKKRQQEMSKLYDDQDIEVGLYGDWQTEEYQPEHVVDGIVPKNRYGNVDLFKPSMCPIGGVHLPYDMDGIELQSKRAPYVKVDEGLLLGPAGLPKVKKLGPRLKYLGKGHEVEDLRKLLNFYKMWAHELHPRLKFQDFVKAAEKTCRSKRSRVYLETWIKESKRSSQTGHSISEMERMTIADDAPPSSNDTAGHGLFSKVRDVAVEEEDLHVAKPLDIPSPILPPSPPRFIYNATDSDIEETTRPRAPVAESRPGPVTIQSPELPPSRDIRTPQHERYLSTLDLSDNEYDDQVKLMSMSISQFKPKFNFSPSSSLTRPTPRSAGDLEAQDDGIVHEQENHEPANEIERPAASSPKQRSLFSPRRFELTVRKESRVSAEDEDEDGEPIFSASHADRLEQGPSDGRPLFFRKPNILPPSGKVSQPMDLAEQIRKKRKAALEKLRAKRLTEDAAEFGSDLTNTLSNDDADL